MHRLDYIRKFPWIGDYNALVDAINRLINKAQEKKNIVNVEIKREIKDYSFFNWDDVELPYKADYILTTLQDCTEVLAKYAFTYKEANQINKAITEWNIVALSIDVVELVTEKEKKQEAVFEAIESKSIEEAIKWAKKKRGRKKKGSW